MTDAGPAQSEVDAALTIRGGRLFIEQCDATALGRRFGTPLYVTSEDQLLRNLTAYQHTFAVWPGELRILPSIKANSSLAIRRLLTREHVGCDAFGPAELEAAIRGGTPPGLISLNGPTKDVPLLERAVRLGVRVMLDSVEEIERTAAVAQRLGTLARAALRLRPDYRSLQEQSELMPGEGSIRKAAAIYKAGIPTEDLLALPPGALQLEGLVVTGVMAHLGRHHVSPGVWEGMAGAFMEAISDVLAAHPSLRIREVGIGGGLPSPRDPFGRADTPRVAGAPIERRVPPLATYASAILPTVSSGLERLGIDPASVALEVEPGRALFADAGIHLTTVRQVKRETKPFAHTWVETDTSDSWLADTILERNRWGTIVANRADTERSEPAHIVGCTCAPDIIVSRELLPAVEVGDIIAILDTGAYQEASASNFNSLPRPATVLVHGENTELVRRAETVEDVFARDVIPARLCPDSRLLHPAGARVTGLDHVSITTADIEQSLDFYEGLLGLRVRGKGEERGGEIAEITGLCEAHVLWADLHLPGGAGPRTPSIPRAPWQQRQAFEQRPGSNSRLAARPRHQVGAPASRASWRAGPVLADTACGQRRLERRTVLLRERSGRRDHRTDRVARRFRARRGRLSVR